MIYVVENLTTFILFQVEVKYYRKYIFVQCCVDMTIKQSKNIVRFKVGWR